MAISRRRSAEAPSPRSSGVKSGSVIGFPALLREPRRDVEVERRHLVEAGQPEALEEFEAGPVQERPAGRLGPAELDDEPAMQQRPHRVVGIDAADPLDGRLRHGLAVGHDRQRLERRRREPDGVGADVAGDERAAFRRRSRARPGRRRSAAGCRGRGARPRGRRAGRRRSPGPCRRGRRSRAGSVASRRRTGGPRGRPRSARSAAGARASAGGSVASAVGRSGAPGVSSASGASGSSRASAVMRTTPASRRSGRRRARRRRRRPAPRRSSRGRRSDPTAPPVRPRSRGASSARAWPGT